MEDLKGRIKYTKRLMEVGIMDNQITIRKAIHKKDAKDIAALAREIWTEHYTPIIGAEQVEYMLEKFQSEEAIFNQINSQGYIYYMAFCEGKLSGYLSIKPDEVAKEVFLSKLYVEKSFRKKGIAKEFISMLKELYKKPQFNSIWLTVNKNNKGSIAAYHKLGFKIVDEMVTDIGNGFVMDDYKMSMEL